MKTRFLYALAIVLLPAVLTSPVVRAAAVPGTSCTVFPADNIWNTDISQLPVSSSSNTWISHTMPSSGLTHPDFGRPPYGMPFNVVQAGFIGHAIRFTVHNTNDTYLWPARHHAGISDATLPPMGARFRLKSGYDISSYGTEAKVVLTAFKHYGLIVADNGSDWFFQGTEDASR